MDISRFAKKTEHIQKIFAILIIIGAIYMLITALGEFCENRFIDSGKVAINLVRLINSENITFLTSAQNRLENTIKNMEESDVEILDTFKEVATLFRYFNFSKQSKSGIGCSCQIWEVF